MLVPDTDTLFHLRLPYLTADQAVTEIGEQMRKKNEEEKLCQNPALFHMSHVAVKEWEGKGACTQGTVLKKIISAFMWRFPMSPELPRISPLYFKTHFSLGAPLAHRRFQSLSVKCGAQSVLL